MKLGIAIQDTWAFLHEIHADLAAHHDTEVFKPRRWEAPFFRERLRKTILRRDMRAFLGRHDVVFFEWASELLAVATGLPKTCGIVTRLHRFEMYHWAHLINWDAVDRLILVSEAKRAEFTGRFPDHAHKIAVIPEAVSLERFQHNPRPFGGDIGILCHLRPRKRVYELVLAFCEMLKARPDLHLHIGGAAPDGLEEYTVAIEALIARLDLRDKITLYGQVEEPERWYHEVDIFFSNGYSEGLQVAPIEAIASGTYCLAHHWDGADELLPAEDLYFSERELVQRTLAYCDMPEGERAQRRARQLDRVRERFDVDRTKIQVRHLLEEVAASRRSK